MNTHVCGFIASQIKSSKSYHVKGFVTISRQAGAGGVTVAEKLAHLLSGELPDEFPWYVFDKNLTMEIIKEHNFSKHILPFLDEMYISEVEDTIEDMLGLHPTQRVLVRRANMTIRRLAEMGRVVLVGRGGPEITKDLPGGVHVRLVGSVKKRIEHLREYFQLTEREAINFIRREDRGRQQYLKKYFNQDINNPLLYDLVINTDRIAYEEVATIIKDELIRKMRTAQAVLMQ